MMLQICLSVTSGNIFLGYDTVKNDCLYLALEDSKNRLQDRINKVMQGGKAPPNLYLSTKADSLDNGLFSQLEEEIKQHPNIKLIIIDTLQKIRGKTIKNETSYNSDYREMTLLKDFADKNKLCILLVHHLRKLTDDDVFNRISGSNGIMGACDTIFIISKDKRQDERALLSMTGRDINQNELIIAFNKETFKWEKVCSAKEQEFNLRQVEYETNPIILIIKSLLEDNGIWSGTSSELIDIYFQLTEKQCFESPTSIGMLISNYESLLINDGIEHSIKRKDSKRIHTFKYK